MQVTISPELTFSPSEVSIILKEYVCAVCHADLGAQPIPNEERIFIVCPEHGNVCHVGRVMRSTVSIKAETSHRDTYPVIASFPDLFGDIWARGVPDSIAQKISREYVCALCGDDLIPQAIMDGNRIVPGRLTLACRSRHGNVGFSGIGMVRKEEYEFIKPVDVRRIVRQRAGMTTPESARFSEIGEMSFSKIGAITLDDTNFRITPFQRNTKLGAKIKAIFGEKPTSLPVRVLADKRPQSWECYNRGAMCAKVIRADGEPRWEYFRDPETQEIEIRAGVARTVTGMRMMSAPVDLSMTIYTDSRGNAATLQATYRLRVIVPQLTNVDGVPQVGYFEIALKGLDAVAMESSIQSAKELAFQTGKMLPELSLTLLAWKDRITLDIPKGE